MADMRKRIERAEELLRETADRLSRGLRNLELEGLLESDPEVFRTHEAWKARAALINVPPVRAPQDLTHFLRTCAVDEEMTRLSHEFVGAIWEATEREGRAGARRAAEPADQDPEPADERSPEHERPEPHP